MFKRLLIVLLVIISLSTASCSKMIPVVDSVVKASNAAKADNVQVDSANNQSPIAYEGQISRAEAGLSTIPVKDISGLVINNRVEALLNGDAYIDSDYSSGIVEGHSGWILNERFDEKIIGSIKVGSDIDEVIKQLGEPSAKENDYIFYKTNKLSIVFKGTDKVAAVVLSPAPGQYDKDILSKLMEKLTKENQGDLFSVLQENTDIKDFFHENGHIHGGGWYADSAYGIAVEDFSGITITVYNNFEGNLYESEGLITYEDKDNVFDSLKGSLDSYFQRNEAFAKDGVLSPSGKFNSIYEWITSDSHYFTIRTTDFSKPDFYIAVPSGDYKWINDDYILYLDFHSTLPFVVKMADGEQVKLTNIFYETGLIKTNDSTEGIGSNDFGIASISGKDILIKDRSSAKAYRFRYDVDSTGEINFIYINN